jgi:cell division protein FtsZ
MRVSVVATGIDAATRSEAMPLPKRAVAEPVAAARPAAAAAAPARAPQPEPRVEPAPAPSFADHQVGETDRGVAFEEPQAQVPQPATLERTAPFGQPKFDGERRPGEPSPDALRRLQAAVQNVPKPQPMVRPIAPQPPREAERHSRLTINSLIHKMTGQIGREQQTALRPRSPEPELEPRPTQVAEAGYEESERERVDIPAFLRRQAN